MIICYHEVKRENNDSDTIGTHSSLTQFTPLLEARFDWPKKAADTVLHTPPKGHPFTHVWLMCGNHEHTCVVTTFVRITYGAHM